MRKRSSQSDDTYDEHLTLSWLQAGIKSGADYSADDWGRFWLDKFNVDFDIIAVTMDPSDWDEAVEFVVSEPLFPQAARLKMRVAQRKSVPNRLNFFILISPFQLVSFLRLDRSDHDAFCKMFLQEGKYAHDGQRGQHDRSHLDSHIEVSHSCLCGAGVA